MPPTPDAKSHPTIVTCLSYRDAPAAIDWLCRAFGFEKQLVVPGDTPGTIRHSQLVLGNGMVMVSTSPGHDAARRWQQRSPADVQGGTTAGLYVVVEDVDAHARRAAAAGARIVDPVQDKPYGGRDYGCLDPEGTVWYFGSYDPFAPGSA